MKGKGPCVKGLQKANGMLPETAGFKKRQGDGCYKGPFARRERRKLATGGLVRGEQHSVGRRRKRMLKSTDKAKSTARRMIQQKKMFSEVKAAVRRAKWQERMFSETKAAARRAKWQERMLSGRRLP